MKKIYAIKKSESAQAAETLSKALAKDPMMQWLFDTPDHHIQKSAPLIQTWVNYAILYGKAWRSENFESIALRKKPCDNDFSFWRLLRSGMMKSYKLLGKAAFNRLMVLDKILIAEKKKALQGKSAWYCWSLGTLPDKQKQGYGRALVEKTFSVAQQDNLPCYLEVANPTSYAIHEKFGYQTCGEFFLPDSDIKMHTMIRMPSQSK